MLLARLDQRRAAGVPAIGRAALRPQSRERLRARRRRQFRGRVRARSYADSMRAMQHLHEVSRSAPQGRRYRRAMDRHRALRADRRRRAAPRSRPAERSVVLPVGHSPGCRWAHAPSRRRRDEGRDARRRPPARPRGRCREDRKPGHLLRSRRRSHQDHSRAPRRRRTGAVTRAGRPL